MTTTIEKLLKAHNELQNLFKKIEVMNTQIANLKTERHELAEMLFNEELAERYKKSELYRTGDLNGRIVMIDGKPFEIMLNSSGKGRLYPVDTLNSELGI